MLAPARPARGSSSRSIRSAGNSPPPDPHFPFPAQAFHRPRRTTPDVRASLGLTPIAPISARGELVHLRHFGGRNSDYANLSAGLEPVRGLAVTGTARIGRVVAAPAILADPAQDVRDLQVAVGWNRARLGFEVAYARASALAPPAFAHLRRRRRPRRRRRD